jgi:hypothetical protein
MPPGGNAGYFEGCCLGEIVKFRAADTIITNEKLLEVKTNE